MKKVFIIDDEPLVRRSLARAFKDEKVQIFEATNAAEGLELWKKMKPDLVFLDVLMPGMSGVQMLQQLSDSEKKHVIIILISAFTGEYNHETAKNWGAQDFIPKPFDDIFLVKKKALELLSDKKN